MASSAALRSPFQEMATTTYFITNLHCPSCVEAISASLYALDPTPEDIFVSIVSHSVVVRHAAFLAVDDISAALELAGFEIHSIFQDKDTDNDTVEVKVPEKLSKEWHSSLESAVSRWGKVNDGHQQQGDMRKREVHMEQCEQCRCEGGGISLEISHDEKPHPIVTTSPKASFDGSTSIDQKSPTSDAFVVVAPLQSQLCKVTLAITGMTCSSCVSAITHAVEELPFVQSINVNLLTHTGTVVFEGKHRCDEVVSTVEDCGFDVLVEKVEDVPSATPQKSATSKQQPDTWRATYAVGGMTCSRCSGFVTDALQQHPWVEQVDVNLISNTATVVFRGKEHLPEIKESIEDAGYDATLDQVLPGALPTLNVSDRSIAIRVQGMFCHHCPTNIVRSLEETFGDRVEITAGKLPFSLQAPVLYIKYRPEPPALTIRQIFHTTQRHRQTRPHRV